METQLSMEQLLNFITALREEGVECFDGLGFHVEFAEGATGREPAVVPVPRPTAVKKPKSLWEDETLWPGGAPPKFPGSDQ